jgi:hypothetical protein
MVRGSTPRGRLLISSQVFFLFLLSFSRADLVYFFGRPPVCGFVF